MDISWTRYENANLKTNHCRTGIGVTPDRHELLVIINNDRVTRRLLHATQADAFIDSIITYTCITYSLINIYLKEWYNSLIK